MKSFQPTMSVKNDKNSGGFTIIELLVATVVFSIVLVVVLAAFVQISRLYYKGVALASTQNDTRTITQDLEDDIKFVKTTPTSFIADQHNPPDKNIFCIGRHVYEYQLFHQLGDGSSPNDYALRRSNSTNCTPTTKNQEELLGNGMQLNALSLTCQFGRCIVHVHVVFYGGTPDMFYSPKYQNSGAPWKEPDAQCTGALTSSQYCAVVDYTRTVLQSI